MWMSRYPGRILLKRVNPGLFNSAHDVINRNGHTSRLVRVPIGDGKCLLDRRSGLHPTMASGAVENAMILCTAFSKIHFPNFGTGYRRAFVLFDRMIQPYCKLCTPPETEFHIKAQRASLVSILGVPIWTRPLRRLCRLGLEMCVLDMCQKVFSSRVETMPQEP
jgi:hypothetical protein